MIAKKRGLDSELSSIAAMLHDLHAYKTGIFGRYERVAAECKLGINDS